MNRHLAQSKCDRLRQADFAKRTGLTYEVEPLTEGSRNYVVRSYRNGRPTGTTYHV